YSSTVSKPVSLLDIPHLCHNWNNSLDWSSVSDQPWVLASDYDGRNNRHLLSVRTETLKYIMVSNKGEQSEEYELYHLLDDPGEHQNLVSGDLKAEKPLQQLAERRNNHEQELLTTKEAVEHISR
ncbi:MAG: hypothetical protein ABEI06_01120, partial [Halobacteriaceae archaeon]